MPDASTSFITGFLLSATLIVAIGAQNAFVLRQGLRREHVGLLVAFCAASDAVLMAAGVATLGAVAQSLQRWAWALAAAGAAFLAAYGLRALWRAARPQPATAAAPLAGLSRRQSLAQAAAFTFLNPHVYLDTVWLFGTVGAQQAAALRPWFVTGGAVASLLWFAALGHGARVLAPWFARPVAWRVLDAVVGVTMLVIAAGLARQAAQG